MINIDSMLCKAMNVINGLRFFTFSNKKLLLKNRSLKLSKNDDDVCFIIGNGPSLKDVDLTLLNEYPSFTVNRFYEKPGLFRATYHVLIDPAFGEGTGFETLKNIYRLSKKTKMILNDRFYKKMEHEKMTDGRTYFVHLGYVQHKEFVSCDMEHCMTGALNVLPVAIECAIWMGYKKIFLLGCDFDFYGNTKYTHFYDEDTPFEDVLDTSVDALAVLIRCALVRQHHFALEYKAQTNDVKIVNLTKGSLLDTYEKADLNSILESLNDKK